MRPNKRFTNNTKQKEIMLTLFMDGSPVTTAEDTKFGLDYLRDTFDRNRHAFPYTWDRAIIRDNESKIVWDSQSENVAKIIDAQIWED